MILKLNGCKSLPSSVRTRTCNKIRILGLAVIVFITAIFFNTAAVACGTLKIATRLYNKPNASVRIKAKALEILGCRVHDDYYRNSKSDYEILKMLQASTKSSQLTKYVTKILKTYRCLPRIKRDSTELSKLIKKYLPKNCPGSTQVKNYYLINAGVAKFYQKPDASSKVKYRLGRFYIVEKISQPSSKWMEVKSWGNEKGFVLSSKLKRFRAGQL